MKKSLGVLMFIVLITGCFSKMVVERGGFSSLNKGDTVNVVYDYGEMRVDGMTELAYLATMEARYEKKTARTGENFQKRWDQLKFELFPYKFEALLNKYNRKLIFGKYPQAKYTLTLTTIHIQSEWHIGVAYRHAFLDAKVKLTDSNSNILAEIEFLHVKGSQGPANMKSESYARCGKMLADRVNGDMRGKK